MLEQNIAILQVLTQTLVSFPLSRHFLDIQLGPPLGSQRFIRHGNCREAYECYPTWPKKYSITIDRCKRTAVKLTLHVRAFSFQRSHHLPPFPFFDAHLCPAGARPRLLDQIAQAQKGIAHMLAGRGSMWCSTKSTWKKQFCSVLRFLRVPHQLKRCSWTRSGK